jgi:drug/metabolite transporter (DMT)-like permease
LSHSKSHPYLLLSSAALLWAGNFVLGRAVNARIPPVGLAFWRWAVALVFLAAFTRRRLVAQWPLLARSWTVLVPLGILGVGNFNTLVYLGLGETSATNALLLNSACPAFIVAISSAAGLGRATLRQLLGIALSLAGVLVILTRGDPRALLSLGFNRGDFWVLAAVLSWAFYTVLLAKRPEGVEPLVLLTACVGVGVAWIAPFYAWEMARGARVNLNPVTIATVLYVALAASVAAYAFWNRGVAEVGANRAGVFLHLMPAFGTVLAVLVLRESFHFFQLTGIALILGGVSLAGTSSSGPGTQARRS